MNWFSKKSDNPQNFFAIEPTSFNDVQFAIECLKKKRRLTVSLESVDDKTSLRFLDFLSGAVFALNGSIVASGFKEFVVCPKGAKQKNADSNDRLDFGKCLKEKKE